MMLFKKIPPYILFCCKVYILHLIIFSALRVAFFLYNKPVVPIQDATVFYFQAFFMGIRFDTVMLCYMFTLVFLILSISHVLKERYSIIRYIALFFIFFFLGVYQFVICADIPYYNQFGNHLNQQAFLWDSTPGFITGMIFSDFGYWGWILLFIVSMFFSVKGVIRFFKAYQLTIKAPTFLVAYKTTIVVFLLTTTLIIYGARGRVSQKSPIHEGVAVISANSFVNNLGLNPNYVFWKSLLKAKKRKPYKEPKNSEELRSYAHRYLGQSDSSTSLSRVVKTTGAEKPMNVVVVIMESMATYKMGYYGGKKLTPQLDNLIKESVFFDHFFSSGIHTFNGIFSTISGYPSILHEHPLQLYTKQPFHGIGSLLKERNYDTYFYTTHDEQFDNMSGFLKINGFEHIVGQSDLPSEKVLSTLGVPDHVLFEEFIKRMNIRKDNRPVLSVLLTASDHGPWKIPTDISFKPNGSNEQENCTMYADWSIGQFMQAAKQQVWYDNTLFVFLGDHGLAVSSTYEMPISYHHIPCVIHAKHLNADTIHHVGYQPDITATIMGLLNYSYTNETFGIDLLKQQHPFVVFTADDKIGAVTSDGYYYYNLLTTQTQRLWKYELLDNHSYLDTKKPLVDTLAYGTNAIIETANYYIRNGYYMP